MGRLSSPTALMSAAGPYELQRLANIERNHAELARLGLLGSPTLGITTSRKRAGGSGTQRRSKKRRAAEPARGSRRSLRLGATPSSGAPAPAPPPAAPLEHGDAEWVQELFSANALPGSPTSASPRWERRRAHQHLTLSRCGRMIATTGCAGYVRSPSAFHAFRTPEKRRSDPLATPAQGGLVLG